MSSDRSSTRSPFNGIVATQHPLAAKAAVEMLAAGGTAADAAVAAGAVLTVVDPRSTGLGGDLFSIYWRADASQPVGLAAAGVSPRALTVDSVRASGFAQMPVDGPWSVTVPGAPAGWQTLLKRYGKLDVSKVLGPAIDLARVGFNVTPAVAAEWTSAVDKLRRDPTAAETFLVEGRPPAEGERFRIPDLASTLELLAEEGADPFYRGPLAERIAATVTAAGGPLRLADLAEWEGPEWVDPLKVSFRGLDIYEMPPPGQGVVVLEALRIYEELESQDLAGADHFAIESLKLAYEDANVHLADPSHVNVPIADLLGDDHIASQRARISRDKVLTADVGRPSDTVYAAVVDGDGSACSFIQSVYDGFGSGVVVPGTGLALQNRGSGFRLEDDHPNRPAPSKRPYHTIIPSMLGKGQQVAGCLGVVGGYMQTQGQLQVLRNVVDRGMTPQEACDAPRFRVYRGTDVAFEEGYDESIVEDLRANGHEPTHLEPLERGGAQLLLRDGDTYRGGSDRRKDGLVAEVDS